MKTPVLFYGYVFFNRVGVNIKKRRVGIQIASVIGSKHEYAFCIGAKAL
jgi:hypothetical protein